jgi:myo-inositol-1(or 4)-monophosphatase
MSDQKINLDDVLEVALTAALEAGAILLEFAGKLNERPDFDGVETWTKSSRRDLATAADVASERAIVARIRESFPDHAIEAEEEVCDGGDARSGPRWFVDPLDGTINFVHGLPAYCVSIGFYIDGQPVASVVHLPRMEETFHAVLGRGAFLDGTKIAVSEATQLSDSVLATGFPYRRGELAQDNLANFSGLFYDIRGIRRMGSAAVDLAYTAVGRLDGFWELHLSSFDVAGGALLVREAGGVVTDADGGEDWLHGGHIIAAGPDVHRALLGRIAHE